MKSWLDQCSDHHGPACIGYNDDEFLEMATQSYFGVIDTLDMCLKSLPLKPGKSPKKKDSNLRTTRGDVEIVRINRDRYGSSPSEVSIEEMGQGTSRIKRKKEKGKS